MLKLEREIKGFTLLEVIIAIVIMAFSSIAIYSAITNSYSINTQLSTEFDRFLSISTAMKILDKDISYLYSPIIGKTSLISDNTPDLFWSAPQRKDNLRRTRFSGEENKITFFSLSNRRIQRDAPETNLQKIILEIVREDNGTYSLKRTTYSNDLFNYDQDEIENNSLKTYTLLDKLNDASFSFYKLDEESWEKTWNSEDNYTKSKSRFPSMVAIEFKIENPINPDNSLKFRSEFLPVLKLNTE